MKKRIWSLVLCIVLVCTGFAGCGDKDDDGTQAIKQGRLVKEKMQGFVDSVSDMLSKSDKDVPPLVRVGYDVEGDFTFDQQYLEYFLAEAGAEDVEVDASALVIGIKGSLDIKESDQMRLTASMSMGGQEDILALDLQTQDGVLCVGMPGLTEDYFGIPFEYMLPELVQKQEGLPEADDILAMWQAFSAKFVGAFEYQGRQEQQTIGLGDYKLTGEKYTAKAQAEGINAAFEALEREMNKSMGLEERIFVPVLGERDAIYANYYVGKNGTYAWEFEGDISGIAMSVVFISAGKGFYLYLVDEDGVEQPIAFSVKESARKGKITVLADEKIEFAYDNYTKNSIELSMTGEEDAFKIRLEDGTNALVFDKKEGDVALEGKVEMVEDHYELTVQVTEGDIKLGTFRLNAKMRDFEPYGTLESIGIEETDEEMRELLQILEQALQDAGID